ncbi:MAG TPA: carboxymuconolactone decarboxylase family protein [Gemmatimonadales bacterium]|nr:carboxymuconolactone decarboxylase family protein [Gemmatimonadales bacterium]
MILLRWLTSAWRALAHPPTPRPGPWALRAYAALGRHGAGDAELEPRLRLLVRQLAAELSGCRWCIERGRHGWRQAFLPLEDLRAVRHHASAPAFSPPERAALAFTEAVSRYRDREGGIPAGVLAELRRHFSEDAVAALTQLAAGEHFFDRSRGALGADALDSGASTGAAASETRVPSEHSALRHLW